MATVRRWPRVLGYDDDPVWPSFTVEFTSTSSETYVFRDVDEMTFVMIYIAPVLGQMRNGIKPERWRQQLWELAGWSRNPPHGGARM